ncbi:MAG: undecaprenyl-phosphate alpha-N-acetylglucosaminyl 1-phosphate transferase [Coriobacteriaceae bacterium]|nr:undecaprenyl-phosphate alpha-N-acetylglucosaminyl 1-phosphate transferase [Coriobacteriaceae bacterium]
MALWQYALLLGIAGAVTLLLTPAVRVLARRVGAVAVPGGRHVHEGEIPRFGGVAMFAGFVVAIAVQVAGERWLGWDGQLLRQGMRLWGVLGGTAIIWAAGVADDIHPFRPGQKLLGQLVAATVVVASGLRVEFLGNPFGGGLVYLGLLSIPVTMLWLVGFANVINLIDGLDGLAAGVSGIAAFWFLVLAAQGNQLDAAAFAAALLGCCLGFLRYNFHPATVFMGDSGSMFLGFTLGSMALLGVMKSVAAITLAVPLLIIGIPVFDTASAIVRRLRHNRPIQEADRGHIHHRLLGRGLGQRTTVLIIYAWSFALGVGGYSMRHAPSSLTWLTFVLLAVPSGFMAYWLGLFDAAHHHAEE